MINKIGLNTYISRHKNQLKRFLLRVSFISDMLDSMDSLVDRNESPSEPFPGYVPQTAPAKTALPPNGKIFIKFLYSKDTTLFVLFFKFHDRFLLQFISYFQKTDYMDPQLKRCQMQFLRKRNRKQVVTWTYRGFWQANKFMGNWFNFMQW